MDWSQFDYCESFSDVLSLLSEIGKDFKHLYLTESLICNFLWCCLIFVLIIVTLEALFSSVFCGITRKVMMLVLWRWNVLLYRIHPEQAVCSLGNIFNCFSLLLIMHLFKLLSSSLLILTGHIQIGIHLFPPNFPI